MKKTAYRTISQKNRVIANIIEAISTRKAFLIVCHHFPDADCVGSGVAFALLLRKLNKKVSLYFNEDLHENFNFLKEICHYNLISIYTHSTIDDIDNPDTIIAVDSPNISSLEKPESMEDIFQKDDVLKIEVDHHFGADAEYFAEKDYSLVTEASSASELVGQIALKLAHREDLVQKHQIQEVFSRNLVVAILTGIVSDSQMGKFLKTEREKRSYASFTCFYNYLLKEKTNRKFNFSSKDEIFGELTKLSQDEAECFRQMKRYVKKEEHLDWAWLPDAEAIRLEDETGQYPLVNASRIMADYLAESSGYFGLVLFRDQEKGLYQFRLRRSEKLLDVDLRKLLADFHIESGGGHEGAIAFRIPLGSLDDPEFFIQDIIKWLDKQLQSFH